MLLYKTAQTYNHFEFTSFKVPFFEVSCFMFYIKHIGICVYMYMHCSSFLHDIPHGWVKIQIMSEHTGLRSKHIFKWLDYAFLGFVLFSSHVQLLKNFLKANKESFVHAVSGSHYWLRIKKQDRKNKMKNKISSTYSKLVFHWRTLIPSQNSLKTYNKAEIKRLNCHSLVAIRLDCLLLSMKNNSISNMI